MRFFLCAFGAFSLGIPVYTVSSLITVPWEVKLMIDRDRDENTYFSLPHFFKSEDKNIRHGVILKPQVQKVPLIGSGGDASLATGCAADIALGKDGFTDRRNVLLVTAVEKEEDIPQEEIRPLPAVLETDNIFTFFSGINFNGPLMNVFIDPATLILRMLQSGQDGGPSPVLPGLIQVSGNSETQGEEKAIDKNINS
jgi:hypothetical protein